LLAFDSTLAKKTDEEITNFSIRLAFESTVDNFTNFSTLPKGEFFIEDLYARLKHYPHTFHDFHADLIINEKDFSLKDFSGVIDETDFHFDGVLKNYPVWFENVKKGNTKFEFNLVSHTMKLHDLLSYQGENYLPADYRNEEIKELKLHGIADLVYDDIFRSADIKLDKLEGKLKIHPLKLEQFKGRIHFEDEHLLLENFSGIMGRSDFTINMVYYFGNNPTIRKRDNYFLLTSGFLDVDQLTNYNEDIKVDHENAFNIFEVPFTEMKIKAEVIKMNYHKLWFRNFRTVLRMQENHYLYIDTLNMRTAGGNISMKGYFNGSNPKMIYLKSQIEFSKVNLKKLMVKLDNFGQDYIVGNNLRGELSGIITGTLHVHPCMSSDQSGQK
jgi:hypothetical protein